MLSACGLKPDKSDDESDRFSEIKPDYAKEFTVHKRGDSTLLTVYMDESHSEPVTRQFTLVNSDSKMEDAGSAIQVPCKKIICLSSTQLAYFFELDEIDDIVAINSSRYLFHEGMNKKIANGEVKRIGKEGSFNLEVIAALNPDVIFVSPFKDGGYDALRQMGIPLVPMGAYNEQTPLGRAEWIKMMALFIGKVEKADSIFENIESRYLSLKKEAGSISERPTIFSGKMRSGSWYIPGGDSFYARMFRDAGAEYVIQDDEQGAYPVDFETMYKKAHDADFWRVVNPEKKGLLLDEFIQQDSRYADFKAAREGNVLLCNIREKPYYEQAAIKPDVLLADYIHFFHPNLLPDHKPEFYNRLNK